MKASLKPVTDKKNYYCSELKLITKVFCKNILNIFVSLKHFKACASKIVSTSGKKLLIIRFVFRAVFACDINVTEEPHT
jgi:hypothetical protein